MYRQPVWGSAHSLDRNVGTAQGWWPCTLLGEPLQQAQGDVDGLHDLLGVAARLVLEAEPLQQPAQHRQQPRLLLVIMQQPAPQSRGCDHA